MQSILPTEGVIAGIRTLTATLRALQRLPLWTWYGRGKLAYQNTQSARMGLYARLEERFPLQRKSLPLLPLCLPR